MGDLMTLPSGTGAAASAGAAAAALFAGGIAAPDAKQFSMSAKIGDPNYAIGENKYLTANASSVSYEVTITLNDDDTWSYSELTTLHMKEFGDPFPHTDSNTLVRIK